MRTNYNKTDNIDQPDFNSPFRGLGGRSCIIVEDEELPRLSLKSKLETYHPDIQILDMCDNCDDALESILRHKPQLLFLDIQLPGKNSLWLIEQLEKIMKLPLIIFTTAFTDPEYLIKAIKVSAVDYLNKPINIIELAQAIEKARKKLEEETLLKSKQRVDNQCYTFRTLNSHLILHDQDIVYVQADGNYARIQLLRGKEEMIFERFGIVEKKLNPDIFFRAGRSILINKNYIHKFNSKSYACQLMTPFDSYNIILPKDGFNNLMNSLSNPKS